MEERAGERRHLSKPTFGLSHFVPLTSPISLDGSIRIAT
jgi:hypothetical protein